MKNRKGIRFSPKISISYVRILLGFFAIFFVGLVVLNWWWAYYHDGYVVISFVEFGEMQFEFFLFFYTNFFFFFTIFLNFFYFFILISYLHYIN